VITAGAEMKWRNGFSLAGSFDASKETTLHGFRADRWRQPSTGPMMRSDILRADDR